jgi:hypothetical protein
LLDGFRTGFTGSDANGLLDGGDKYLAVANLAGACGIGYCLNNLFHDVVGYCQFNFCLRQKIDDVLCAAIKLCVTALSPETFDFRYGYALNANVSNRLADVIKLEWLNDRCNHFHVAFPLCSKRKGGGVCRPLHGKSEVECFTNGENKGLFFFADGVVIGNKQADAQVYF